MSLHGDLNKEGAAKIKNLLLYVQDNGRKRSSNSYFCNCQIKDSMCCCLQERSTGEAEDVNSKCSRKSENQ